MILCYMLAMQVSAQTCGTTAEGMEWNVSSEGVLSVSGCGKIPSYAPNREDAPWSGISDSITEIHIGEGVRSVGEFAFRDCHNLRSVSIGKDVAKIGRWAFMGCYGITNVRVFARLVPTIASGTFEPSCIGKIMVEVPYGRRKAFLTDRIWKQFASVKGAGRGSVRDYIDAANEQ